MTPPDTCAMRHGFHRPLEWIGRRFLTLRGRIIQRNDVPAEITCFKRKQPAAGRDRGESVGLRIQTWIFVSRSDIVGGSRNGVRLFVFNL